MTAGESKHAANAAATSSCCRGAATTSASVLQLFVRALAGLRTVECILDAELVALRRRAEAGAGQRFKLVVNTWLLAAVEGVAEAISLARALGLDPNDVLDALSGGPLDMPYLQLKGKVMIERSFEPSFKASLAEKDAGLVLEAAERVELELPLVEAVQGASEQALDLGHADKDMASVVEVVGRRAAAR